MKKKIIFFIVFFLSACVTVNIYFPAAAVRQAADKIVEETWGGQTDGEKEKEAPRSRKFNTPRLYAFWSFGKPVFAQTADINVSNPAIRALKGSIKKRSGLIKPFLDKGNVGITKHGLLEIRTTQGLSLRNRAHVKQLVEAENRDREALYREIARANNFPKERVRDIKRIFAGSWIKRAKGGWWIQDIEGKWRRK
ncbi:MAG: YdbL family protein [Candidatus Binatia bacterium]